MRNAALILFVTVLLLPAASANAREETAVEKAHAVAHLRMLAREALDKLDADPLAQRLRSLGRVRDELDRCRDRALVAIFHPVDRKTLAPNSKAAQALQKIVDRRVAVVRTLWDQAEAVVLPQSAEIGQRLRLLGRLFDDLKRRGDDAPKLRAAAGPLPLFWYMRSVGIRDYHRSAAEVLTQHYDGWVIGVYNEARSAECPARAREQIRYVNRYRQMLGQSVRVRAAGALKTGMDEAAIVKLLDTATIIQRLPLHALRIDSRLRAAAQSHAQTMKAGGFFSHMTPTSVPASTGRSPADRINAAGYKAQTSTEILSAGGASAAATVLMWQRARAQHQILLASGADVGAGHAGRFDVFVIASGDGGPQAVQQDLKPRRGS